MQLRTECVGLNWYLNKCHVFREVKAPGSDAVVRSRLQVFDFRLLNLHKTQYIFPPSTSTAPPSPPPPPPPPPLPLPPSGKLACHDSDTSQQNPAITPLSSVGSPSSFVSSSIDQPRIADFALRLFGLFPYLLGLVPDGLEPLVVHAVAKGLDESPLPLAWIHPSE
ncbi:hypothetical protein FNYG_07726 [Fusarium nygamai]|uniref:Uncharacterized protein n=1 Tax=Gibberella nygamai TaxID=42673 RepID=A0A2K0W9F2_GIBNY|nr:hypothetical protein FNYG_07726 [Fusarium nygamai]